MNISFLFRGGALFAAVCLSTVLSWAKPLPSDPRILTGKLENGVTWMYRQHNNPPGKMGIEVHVRTGSLNETDAQRGLAHFIEHMGFNGTEHFAPGTLVPYFESIGMQFGPHLNAYTSFDETVYMLFTPNTDLAQIEKALVVLSDYAFRDLLLEKEIDKERGVILEESRSGKSAGQRIRDELWPQLFEGSRFAERLPIGRDEIIAKATRAEFTDYYRTWYRPENVTVVMVGDALPDPILPLIKKTFGEYKPEAASRPPLGPEFKSFSRERGLVVTDAEMAYCQVQMMNLKPGHPPTVTEEDWRGDLVESLAGWIVGRRFDERVKRGEASYRRAGAGVSDFFHEAVQVSVYATGEARDWSKMLEQAIAEIKAARELGFTGHELDLARKDFLASAERSVRTESTRNANAILGEIISSVNSREPILSAEQDLELYKRFLPTVALGEINMSFKTNFAPGTFAYVVTMKKEGTNLPTGDEVLAKARSAWAEKTKPFVEEAGVTNLLASLPQPGKVVEKSMLDEDLKISSAIFENGVRMYHRSMDYKKDLVLVSISLAGSMIEETADNAGVSQVASLAVRNAATSRISSSKMRDLLTGKNIGVSGSPAGDHFLITVNGSPADLEIGMQEAYALLMDGRIEESAFKNWRLGSLQNWEQLQKLPRFKAQEAMEAVLSNNDPRRGVILPKTDIERLTMAQGQAWYDRLCREAPIEVAVVGDIALEPALELVSRYIGSLPKRTRDLHRIHSLRRSARAPALLERHVRVETVTPQAMAIAGFVGAEARQTDDARALELAELILSSRLVKQVREELAIVYSINANNIPSRIYVDAGRFYAGAPCDPANVWLGLEYFRSEVYYLRFSWLALGHGFLPAFGSVAGMLGVYGIGFAMIGLAACGELLPARFRLTAVIALAAFCALFPASTPSPTDSKSMVQVAGVQLEFPTEARVLFELERLRKSHPETALFVLSEYTFDGAIPVKVSEWCHRHGRYLIAGGKKPIGRDYYNTAFVVGPEGTVIFEQVKSVPIQFFKDGLPAPSQSVWISPWGKIGICVCYDLSYRKVVDELVRQGAQALIVPTMDVEEWGANQHLLHSRIAPLRAAEYRVPIFRLCSSGISQHVNADGLIEAIAPFPGENAPIVAKLKLGRPGRIPIDHWLGPLAPFLALGLMAASWIERKRPPTADSRNRSIRRKALTIPVLIK